ncbi:hypothetical protein VFPBJ_05221 [Purpureocillium lilacinum]|uniref:Mitochondrial-processing peptidase subunit alpha protein n=1 Tax=Purpureocillium lilacinum TaxID=33203 RepID=A0A179GNZ0_PURLI|nr:hypothetical protein VFPBJ_05221 [Purpureocillium lilacinum]
MSLLRKFANGPRVALAVPLVISLFLVTYCVYVSGLSTFSFRTGARVAGWYGDRNRMRNLRKPSGTVRNLVDNGGWLDEVVWLTNTDDKDDLEYLEEIIASNPKRYKKLSVPGETLSIYTLYKAWELLERGRYYVKIDDDIVWMADDAIPRVVTRKMQHPHDFVVSANVINNPPLGFMHYHLGALHPYFPDVEAPADSNSDTSLVSWKPSQQRPWSGPSNYTWPLDRDRPHKNHRWLRVRNDTMMEQTPAAQLKYELWGPSYDSWAIATQMHYSLLENVEEDGLHAYKFRPPWDMGGERIRINFICVYADDVLDTDPANWTKDRGDEDMLVIDLPAKLRRREYFTG